MRYNDFEKEIGKTNLNVFSLGKSTLGKDIFACHVGSEVGNQVLVQASIHAREYITSLLAAEQAEKLQTKNLRFGVYFVLCANPDGVEVVLDGFSTLRRREREFCERNGFKHTFFKANANLVDLNTNFDALWGQGKSNVKQPNFENFVGNFPESEVETKILEDFTKRVRPKLTLSYHTKGEIVYYGFDTQSKESLQRDFEIGQKIVETLGFELMRSFNSCGGYKDWVCDKFDIPSYTIEFGNDNLSHPLGEEVLPLFEQQSENLFDVIEEFVQ